MSLFHFAFIEQVDGFLKFGDLVLDDVPEDSVIDPEIGMGNDIAGSVKNVISDPSAAIPKTLTPRANIESLTVMSSTKRSMESWSIPGAQCTTKS